MSASSAMAPEPVCNKGFRPWKFVSAGLSWRDLCLAFAPKYSTSKSRRFQAGGVVVQLDRKFFALLRTNPSKDSVRVPKILNILDAHCSFFCFRYCLLSPQLLSLCSDSAPWKPLFQTPPVLASRCSLAAEAGFKTSPATPGQLGLLESGRDCKTGRHHPLPVGSSAS